MSHAPDKPARLVWLDGAPVIGGRVELDADDPGLTLGMSVFETLRLYRGVPLGRRAHLARLQRSASTMGIRVPDALGAQLDGILGAWGLRDGGLRITVTGGGATILRVALLPEFPPTYACVTRSWEPSAWLPGGVKHGSRALGQLATASSGADEVLWVDGEGNLLEGTRANIVAIRGRELWTPPLDGRILPGVTRQLLIDAAAAGGWTIREAPLPRDASVDELVLTSTLKEVMPISSLDGQPRKGGEGSQALGALFRGWIDRELGP